MSEDKRMAIWNAVARPPIAALKTIGGGRLRGMTDVNPQWRYQAMTEQFGPCGDGWKFEISKLWTEPGPDGEVMAFAMVHVFFRLSTGGPWSDPIPGIGGSSLVTQEKSGLHANDEGYKMAVTDALSVALKQLGIAADIYAGRFDGSKYKDAPVEAPKIEPNPAMEATLRTATTAEELSAFWKDMTPEERASCEKVKDEMKKKLGVA